MKIHINRSPRYTPWGGGALFVNAFHEHVPSAGHELVPPGSMTTAPDVIMIAGLGPEESNTSAEQLIMYKMMVTGHKDVKLILRVNENDARKGTCDVDKYLLKLAPHVDGTVFVSDWLRDYFEKKGWPTSNSTVIINGVDKEIFKPQSKLNNGKLNIVAHHWSNNEMKGFDIYEQLDEFVGKNPDKFSFTYIGRDRQTFKHTNVIRPLFGKKLGEELGKHDVYVSASRWDPGPNHILEALACELPTLVHVDGGGAVEFAGAFSSYHDWEELKDMITADCPLQTRRPIPLVEWKHCIREYIDFIEATHAR